MEIVMQFRENNATTTKNDATNREGTVVEVLLATDPSMSLNYEAEELDSYLDTIMTSVNQIFRHHSVGTRISIAEIKRVHREKEEVEGEGLDQVTDVDSVMQEFCRWQQQYQVNNSIQADVAVLVTRENLCRNNTEICNTLGLARLGSMCDPQRSCVVAQDTGLILANTVAHELAHTLGVLHDQDQPDGVMAAVLQPRAGEVFWSEASRTQLNKFLSGKSTTCLKQFQSKTSSRETWLKIPAGAAYHASEQCRLSHGGENITVCSVPPPSVEFCTALWCQVGDTCFSSGDPPATGTVCAPHRWCVAGKCVRMEESMDPVDGSWGTWSPWSGCSRSCGAGLSISKRKCDSPKPTKGGKFCEGVSVRYSTCNTQACPPGATDHKTQQCRNKTGREDVRTEESTTPCYLVCSPGGGGSAVGVQAEDGTECGGEVPGLCADGRCLPVGCDWVVGSSQVLDKCGVCGGDGSMCSEVQGDWSDEGTDYDYVEIVSFPIHARNLQISESGRPENYLALVGDSSGQGYINWDREIRQPGTWRTHAGSTLKYEKDEDQQKVTIKEPLTEPIIAFLLRFAPGSKVSWTYTIPYTNATYQVTYSWSMSDWSHCNVTCGGGSQKSIPRCVKDSDPGSIFDPGACDEKEKPQEMIQACGVAVCPPTWWTGPWQVCQEPCEGVRHRTVLCTNSKDQALIDSACSGNPRPASKGRCSESQECSKQRENLENVTKHNNLGVIQPAFKMPRVNSENISEFFENKDIIEINFSSLGWEEQEKDDIHDDNWLLGNWSSCSIPCGSGISHRSATCVGNCSDLALPPTVRGCNLGPCSDWSVGYWSDCDAVCGAGVKTRNVSCSGVCDPATRPENTTKCMEGVCSTWSTGSWSQCNTPCGTGSRQRVVICTHTVTEVPMQSCREEDKPVEEEECFVKCRGKKEVVGRNMRRCDDTLDRTTCQKYSLYCGVRISFTKRCCNTCFQRFKRKLRKV